MQKPAFDPGLTRSFDAPLRRAINDDGSFNVRRRGAEWRAFHPWLAVVNMSWPAFAVLVIGFYAFINVGFALTYFLMGPEAVSGSQAPTDGLRFLNCFFFSGHTLTTVGYGTLAPHGVPANLAATLEALIGLLGFSVITGLLVARVSRPSARIEYSPNALIAPYQNGTALMIRIANQRSNNLLEMEARMVLMQVAGEPGALERKFANLTLERESVLMFPLTWTVVHPIDETSPFWRKTQEELLRAQAEVIITTKGFDETFGQVVHSRHSYRADEFVWGAKFVPAFRVDGSGNLLLELNKVGEHAPVRTPSNPGA